MSKVFSINLFQQCSNLYVDLDGGSQDGKLWGLSSGLVGLQDLLDEPLDLPLRHSVAVTRLTEDVDTLGQFIINTRLAHRCPHDGGSGDSFLVKRVDFRLLKALGAWRHL